MPLIASRVAGAAAPSGARRWAARAFLAAILVQVAATGGVLIVRSIGALSRAASERGLDTEARFLRHYPAAYLSAVRDIRARVGEDDFYLMVDAEPEERGATYALNFLLAPRRGILLGRTRLERGELIARRLAQRKLSDIVVWVHELPRAPELLDRVEAVERLRELE